MIVGRKCRLDAVFRKKLKKTRNLILLCAVGMVLAYTAADILFGFLGLRAGGETALQLDSTPTSEVFGFWKWGVATRAGITVAKTVKGRTNSDDDEGEGIV